MKKTLTILSAVAMLHAGGAMAKQKHLEIPQSALPAGISAEIVNKKLAQMQFLNTQSGVANKTTATERVTWQSDYDYTQPAGSQLTDSLEFNYSHGRGSAFDWLNLDYDYTNQYSAPSPTNFGTSYVNFDTAEDYVAGSVIAIRSYNAANQVIRNENQSEIDLYNYDASNRLIKLTAVQNSGTSWDSSYRDFYKYNSSGYLILDSAEQWDASTSSWTPYVNLVYTNDASGRPTSVKIDVAIGGGITLTVARIQTTYLGTTSYPTVVLVQALNSSFTLENNSKDTLGYTSGTITTHNTFQWDTTANVWVLANRELRHLNSASLPDSVWYGAWTSGVPSDSGYYKLAYNSNNNPTYRRDYTMAHVIESEMRWYYGPVESAGVGTVKATKLEFYPNPVNDKIQLRGITQGNYQIFNAAGQLMQTGKVQNGGSIPVQFLSPGMYTLSVQEAGRQPATATFVRQ